MEFWNETYIGHISFFHISPNNLTSCGVEINVLIQHFFSKVSAQVHKTDISTCIVDRVFVFFEFKSIIILRILG